jgi:CDP-glucose 4,6-dehydratase
LLGEHLLAGKRAIAQAWNFGPNSEDNRSVAAILTELQTHWPELRWHRSEAQHPHEAGLLYLDSSRAKTILGWKPVWDLSATLAATASWYRQHALTQQAPTYLQLNSYQESAAITGSPWAIQ